MNTSNPAILTSSQTDSSKLLSLKDFNFEIPQEQIAQTPCSQRSGSRLLVKEQNGSLLNHYVTDLPQILPANSLLIFNDTQVFPSRLIGHLETGGKVELFLLYSPIHAKGSLIPAIGKPFKKLKEETKIYFKDGLVACIKSRDAEAASPTLQIQFNLEASELIDWTIRNGYVPLPPYIKRKEALPAKESEDLVRYQTVYAKNLGSVAAPTAGLHFTPDLFKKLHAADIETANITLHVGAGTFMPIKTENIDAHDMHTELYSMPCDTWAKIAQAKKEGRNIIPVGTTSLRCLESFHKQVLEGMHPDELVDQWHETKLFIRPKSADDRFRSSLINGLMTNFHQPCSTLFMLICALVGYEEAKNMYRFAVENTYRFYSYGDSNLLWLNKV
ncbi:MAG: tRNA preQ1(34) S-adenosylmethionine ribosyltransferase-isomerase QueA [Oligoflexales bacterium]|nr:tRNA preQ1(34) S-adenosylmethionine ribosyltransferase-isomerase QueA [Oligoflexales bacterium]